MSTEYSTTNGATGLSKRAADRAAKWATVQAYKQSLGCRECGYNDNPRALQFNHLHSKHKNVSDMISSDYSLVTIFKEIHKCEVLCANCHSIHSGL